MTATVGLRLRQRDLSSGAEVAEGDRGVLVHLRGHGLVGDSAGRQRRGGSWSCTRWSTPPCATSSPITELAGPALIVGVGAEQLRN